MTGQEFQVRLLPAYKRLNRLMFRNALVDIANKTFLAVLIICVFLSAANYLLFTFFGFEISTGILIIFLAVVTCFAFVRLGWEFFHGVSKEFVISKLDSTSNPHNMIAIASEFIDSGKQTGFAVMSIEQGLSKLETISPDMLEQKCPSFKKAIVFCACVSLVICFVTFTAASHHNLTSIKLSADEGVGVLWPISLNPNISDFADGNEDLSSFDAGVSVMNSEDGINSLMSHTQRQISAMLSSSSRVSGKNNAQADKVLSFSNNENVSSMLKRADFQAAGSAQIPLNETEIRSDFFDIHFGLDDDQLNAGEKDKEITETAANVSHHPFTDDRRAAPNNELGRSGNKGKPGDGRGGLDTVKKSRSTAALFPGEMIKVYVPSQPGRGHTKSFESDAPLSSQQDIQRLPISSQDGVETPIDVRAVKKCLRTKTKLYFEELNNYANRASKANSETN